MINYAIPSDQMGFLPMALDRRNASAPTPPLNQLEEACVSTTQLERVRDLKQRVERNTATAEATIRSLRVEELNRRVEDLAARRNSILSLPFLWLRSGKKVELARIEERLDAVEMEILELQPPYASMHVDIRSFIADVQRRLEAFVTDVRGK